MCMECKSPWPSTIFPSNTRSFNRSASWSNNLVIVEEKSLASLAFQVEPINWDASLCSLSHQLCTADTPANSTVDSCKLFFEWKSNISSANFCGNSLGITLFASIFAKIALLGSNCISTAYSMRTKFSGIFAVKILYSPDCDCAIMTIFTYTSGANLLFRSTSRMQLL